MTEKEYYFQRRIAQLANDREALEVIELEAAKGFDPEDENEGVNERTGNQSASN